MKLQRIFAITAVAAFALSTLTGCPWEQEDAASSAPSSSSSRPSHDSDNDTDSGSDDSDPDTPSSTPEDEEVIVEGDGYIFDKKTNTYTVENENGLQAWATAVQTNASTNCTLEENITMSGNASLVGYGTSYTGTFDGNGKTISGLTQPLFDTIGSGGTVKNLTIGGEISGYSGVASYNSGTIVNCTIEAAIDSRSVSIVGGITQNNKGEGKIIGCVVTGDVSGGNDAGGIAVNNFGTITGCVVTGNVSGVNTASGIAVNNFGTITACAVTGDVEAKGNGPVKGDAGGIVRDNKNGAAVTDCYYSGTVTPGQGESVNNIGTRVSGEITWKDAIEEMNKHLTDCEYVFELDANKQPILVKRNSAEQAVNRLLAQFWG